MESRIPLDRILEHARELLGQGKVSSGIRVLRRLEPRVHHDLPSWMAALIPACKLTMLYHQEEIGFLLLKRTLQRFKSFRNEGQWRDLFLELGLMEEMLHFSRRGVAGCSERIEMRFARIRSWRPWMVTFRSLFLINCNRLEECEELLCSPPCPIPRGSLEYAVRLEHLGIVFFMRSRFGASLIVMRSALRLLSALRTLESAYYRLIVLLWIIRLHTELSQFEEGEVLFPEVDAIQRKFRFKKSVLSLNITRHTHYWRSGRYGLCNRLSMEFCLRTRARSVAEYPHLVQALLAAAKGAIVLERFDQAEKLISRAEHFIRKNSLPTQAGLLHVLKASLAAHQGSPSAMRAARSHMKRAEVYFRTPGSNQWWLNILYLAKGDLLLREGKVEEVLQQAWSGTDWGAVVQQPDMHAEGLVLRSFLLLNRELPRQQIYEATLRQLGVVRNPIFLFKILANLYIYSWDVEDRLDLTDLHLRQLDRLREHIAPADYHRLYRTYVTERVVERFKGRFGTPGHGDRRAAAF